MKTFEESILIAKEHRPGGTYDSILAESLVSPQGQEMLAAFTIALLARMSANEVDPDTFPQALNQSLWIAFSAGLITGIEMEKQE